MQWHNPLQELLSWPLLTIQIAKIDAEIEAINKQIEAERKKASLVKGTVNTELTVVITTDTNTNVELKVTYSIDGQPSRTVSIYYRAHITQSTGEDWADAALTLSTAATDAIVQQIPKLEPIKVRVEYRPQNKGPFRQMQWAPQPTTTSVFGTKPAAPSIAGLFGNTASSGGALFGRSAPPANAPIFSLLFPSLPHPISVVPAITTTTSQVMSTFGQPAQSSAFGQPTQPSAFGQQAQPSIFGSTTTSALNPSQSSTEFVLRQASAQPLPEEVDEESTNESLHTVDKPTKLVTQTPIALAYSVRGRSSIPSDGKEHIVTIAVLDFETDVDYVSVPRVDPRVYLQVFFGLLHIVEILDAD
ncbi:hypothetical protein AN958_08781 [Leucoagaricus sp. SymC.cos]|nr:hypothetical protein AN958_08781 [Leucoagaricus sp. SymC.cos]